MPTVQFFVDDWIDSCLGGKAALEAAGPHPLQWTQMLNTHRNELAEYLEGSKHIIGYVMSTELSKEEKGSKGIRWHHQGIIDYDYQKKQNLDLFLKSFAEEKGLSGKTSDWGSTPIKKSKEENLKYILKDQKQLEDCVCYKGYASEYLIELLGKWIPKEEFVKGKKKREGTSYNQRIKEKYESERTLSFPIQSENEKRHILEDLTSYFYQYYAKDKVRLPQRQIQEGIAAVALMYGIYSQKQVTNKAISDMNKTYVIIEN